MALEVPKIGLLFQHSKYETHSNIGFSKDDFRLSFDVNNSFRYVSKKLEFVIFPRIKTVLDQPYDFKAHGYWHQWPKRRRRL